MTVFELAKNINSNEHSIDNAYKVSASKRYDIVKVYSMIEPWSEAYCGIDEWELEWDGDRESFMKEFISWYTEDDS